MSESSASIRLRGYNAARDKKPRHCTMKNHRHRAAWYDGYDCFLNPDQPSPSAPEIAQAKIHELKQMLEDV